MNVGIANRAARLGFDFGIGEAVPYLLVEVLTLGFGAQQLLIELFGNAELAVDRSAPKFQFQKGVLAPVGSGIQRGGL